MSTVLRSIDYVCEIPVADCNGWSSFTIGNIETQCSAGAIELWSKAQTLVFWNKGEMKSVIGKLNAGGV